MDIKMELQELGELEVLVMVQVVMEPMQAPVV